MIPKSIDKAKARLRTAAKQLEDVEAAESYADFADHWYLFLVSAKNVFTMLEQGSKDNPQCRQWFGGVKSKRRDDPLLQYLFQARDDDEHGLADVTKLNPGYLAIGKSDPGYSNDMVFSLSTDERGVPTIHKLESRDGLPILIEGQGPHATLLPVTGRGGVIYDPPKEHLGEALLDTSPLAVGKAGLAYLSRLVDEAEARAA